MAKNYDIIVIGSGPGGYIAAIRASQLGFKTAIIEREHLGGICLNWGCIPTKALLRSAHIKQLLEKSNDFGIKLEGGITADLNSIVKRSRQVSARLNSGVAYLMQKNKIDIIWGHANLVKKGPNIIIEVKKSKPSANRDVIYQAAPPKNTLGEGSYEAKNVIIATGAKPRILPGIEFDNKFIWSYFDALVPKEVPKSLLVVGSGAIGVEFASFYNAMGSKVTIVEYMANILPSEDKEISDFTKKSLEKSGIEFMLSSSVKQIIKKDNEVIAQIESAGKITELQVEKVICAAGVVGNIENLGLEQIGVNTKNNVIVTNEWSQTNIPNIYAIGDVAGAPMLAHKAEEEAVICVEKIANLPYLVPLDKNKIPGCIYCEPQIASVGLTEEQAKALGCELAIGRYNFSANGKAIAMGEDHGFIKTIFNKQTGELLGAHMVGSEVTEMIQGFVLAMNLETTAHEIMHSVFPHPTLSEAMKESVLDAYGQVLNA